LDGAIDLDGDFVGRTHEIEQQLREILVDSFGGDLVEEVALQALSFLPHDVPV
jgi:hypothetical protein